jgi:hypothetical protein
MQPCPSPLTFFEEEPLNWPSAVRVESAKSTKPDSHRGGQGFESPQLHPEPQVRGTALVAIEPLEILCHPDVTGTGQL